MRTTTKQVKEQIQKHIKEYFSQDYGFESDNAVDNIKQQLKSFDYIPSTYNQAMELVNGGTFLCYHSDIKDFLNGLGINEDKKEYSSEKSWKLYSHLIAREIDTMVTK